MTLRTILPAFLLSLLTAACATAPDGADDVDSASSGIEIVACDDASGLQVELETVYLDDDASFQVNGLHKPPRAQLPLTGVPHKDPASAAGVIDPVVVSADVPLATRADPGPNTAEVCACTDDRCVIDWIGSSLGCGVCAHVACDGEERGGCLPCESIDEPAADACVFADVAVSALE